MNCILVGLGLRPLVLEVTRQGDHAALSLDERTGPLLIQLGPWLGLARR